MNNCNISSNTLCKQFYRINYNRNTCSKSRLIKGYVVDPYSKPYAYAAIEFVEYNIHNDTYKILGTVFSDDCGEFGVLINIKMNCLYNINVYNSFD